MSLALLKGCVGLVLGGAAIGVPTYFLTKSSGPSVNVSTVDKSLVASTSSSTSNSQRETVPVTSEQIAREQKFDQCLDNSLKIKVTNVNTREEKIVSLKDSQEYLGKSEWNVESSYGENCKDFLSGKSK